MKKFALTIPEPCHENWNAMSPAEQGRFCAACQKTVVDFTAMSDRQLAQFFKQPKGDVCGRFYTDQLQRPIAPPQKRLPFLRYFFTIALPAFLLTLKAGAQRAPLRQPTPLAALSSDTTKPLQTKADRPTGTRMLGRVAVKPAEKVCLPKPVTGLKPTKDTASRKHATSIRTPVQSTLPVAPVRADKVVPATPVVVATAGLEGLECTNIRLGGVIIVKPVVTKAEQTAKLVTAKKKTVLSGFNIYPNPTPAGATLALDTRHLAEATYVLQIVCSSGEVVQSQEVVAQTKMITLNLKALLPAPYFVRLTDTATGKSFTEILVVH